MKRSILSLSFGVIVRLSLSISLFDTLVSAQVTSSVTGSMLDPYSFDVTGLSTSPAISWSPVQDAVFYHLQIATDQVFSSLVFDDSTLTDTRKSVGPLTGDTGYFWRVGAKTASQSYCFSSPFRFYVIAGDSVYTYRTSDGWNMFSIPVRTTEAALDFIGLGRGGHCFRYAGSYLPTEGGLLRNGPGYWIKFFSPIISFTGEPIRRETVYVSSGWNLIGSITTEVPFSSVEAIPPGIIASPFFGYDGGLGYFLSVTDQPSRSYWVKCSAPGIIIISSH